MLSTEGIDLKPISIDVTDDASIIRAAALAEAEESRLDVLINNAGISGQMVAPSEQSVADVRNIHETNVFGPIRVTQAFLPLLEERGHRERHHG